MELDRQRSRIPNNVCAYVTLDAFGVSSGRQQTHQWLAKEVGEILSNATDGTNECELPSQLFLTPYRLIAALLLTLG